MRTGALAIILVGAVSIVGGCGGKTLGGVGGDTGSPSSGTGSSSSGSGLSSTISSGSSMSEPGSSSGSSSGIGPRGASADASCTFPVSSAAHCTQCQGMWYCSRPDFFPLSSCPSGAPFPSGDCSASEACVQCSPTGQAVICECINEAWGSCTNFGESCSQ